MGDLPLSIAFIQDPIKNLGAPTTSVLISITYKLRLDANTLLNVNQDQDKVL